MLGMTLVFKRAISIVILIIEDKLIFLQKELMIFVNELLYWMEVAKKQYLRFYLRHLVSFADKTGIKIR